jgi:hypothetical protein
MVQIHIQMVQIHEFVHISGPGGVQIRGAGQNLSVFAVHILESRGVPREISRDFARFWISLILNFNGILMKYVEFHEISLNFMRFHRDFDEKTVELWSDFGRIFTKFHEISLNFMRFQLHVRRFGSKTRAVVHCIVHSTKKTQHIYINPEIVQKIGAALEYSDRDEAPFLNDSWICFDAFCLLLLSARCNSCAFAPFL